MAKPAVLENAPTLHRDPPSESLPTWVTLREASFLTGIDEEVLLHAVRSGSVRVDRSLAKRMGERYVLIRSADLPPNALALPSRSIPHLPAPTDQSRQVPPPPPPPARPRGVPVDRIDRFFSDTMDQTAEIVSSHATDKDNPVRRWGVRAARSGAIGLFVGVLAIGLTGFGLGYRPLVVTSPAMAPAVSSGDVLFVRPVPAHSVLAGAVVSFHDPSNPASILFERVRQVRPDGASIRFETKADADTTVHHWSVPVDAPVREAARQIPIIGGLVDGVRTNPVPVAIGAVLFLIALLIVRRRLSAVRRRTFA
jgi:signal peptidase